MSRRPAGGEESSERLDVRAQPVRSTTRHRASMPAVSPPSSPLLARLSPLRRSRHDLRRAGIESVNTPGNAAVRARRSAVHTPLALRVVEKRFLLAFGASSRSSLSFLPRLAHVITQSSCFNVAFFPCIPPVCPVAGAGSASRITVNVEAEDASAT